MSRLGETGGFSGVFSGEANPGVHQKLTPLELDVQLQCAELIFRSLIEGKRIGVNNSEDQDEWHTRVLGEGWVRTNQKQRAEMVRVSKVNGENTPEWLESVSNMGDIAWEVFAGSNAGEVVRRLQDIDRQEIIEQLKELFPKVRDSYYARCGAGEHLYGLRAFIVIFRMFLDDPEVLNWTTKCLKFIVSDVEYNNRGITELSLPLPPAARTQESTERGWAFLRAALDAYLVQLGSEPYSWKPEDTNSADYQQCDDFSDEDEKGPVVNAELDRTPMRSVAVQIAECILAVRHAPAVAVQLKLLREPLPEGAPDERRELMMMVPKAVQLTQEILATDNIEVLANLLELLRLGVSDTPSVVEVQAPSESSDPEAQAAALHGMLGAVRSMMGRSSTD
mmetsp:Transcript_104969/g.306643  ORF Transcript_104969/g.306643 Transcript_104969/m.306643 type:complete len:393 (+) Transcript_104969:49-1227(+)